MEIYNPYGLFKVGAKRPWTSVFKFVQEVGFKWVPARNKRPLTSWKSKGLLFNHNALDAIEYYSYQGVKELLLPTELNALVIIDCDVIRIGDRNVPLGLINFIKLLKSKGCDDLIGPRLSMCCEPSYSAGACRGSVAGTINHNIDFMDVVDIYHLLPEALRCAVVTPSGGMHFYFKSSEAKCYSSNAGVIASHVDVRAKGGVIVSPFSYRCSKKDVAPDEKLQLFNYYYPLAAMHPHKIPELPSSLAKLLPRAYDYSAALMNTMPKVRPKYAGNVNSRDRCQIQRWLQQVYDAPKGTINNTLSVMAGRAFRTVGHGISEGEIWNAFQGAGLSRGLGQEEVRNTLMSARNYGLSRPFS